MNAPVYKNPPRYNLKGGNLTILEVRKAPKIARPSKDFHSGYAAKEGLSLNPERPKKVTSGSIIGRVHQAFVYVGQKSSGALKIGMSGNPQRRCDHLKIELLFTVPVVVEQARLVETIALQNLGALAGDSEWVKCSIEQAADAVCRAWRSVEMIFHVNPSISADEARKERISRCL